VDRTGTSLAGAFGSALVYYEPLCRIAFPQVWQTVRLRFPRTPGLGTSGNLRLDLSCQVSNSRGMELRIFFLFTTNIIQRLHFASAQDGSARGKASRLDLKPLVEAATLERFSMLPPQNYLAWKGEHLPFVQRLSLDKPSTYQFA
jgi:hypothetical protein